jgi:4-oxalocrotonate tautomerase
MLEHFGRAATSPIGESMPHINVTVSGKTDPTLSARIAQQITELTRAHLQKEPAVTAVAITFIAPENWFVGGRSLASQNTNSFWLDIKVTEGTNTKVQMAAYLDAVFSEMTKLLNAVHEDSEPFHPLPSTAKQ